MTTSHAGHTHPATKAGRAACRRGKAPVVRRLTILPVRFIQLINNGTVKHRQLAVVVNSPIVGGNPGYAFSPLSSAQAA